MSYFVVITVNQWSPTLPASFTSSSLSAYRRLLKAVIREVRWGQLKTAGGKISRRRVLDHNWKMKEKEELDFEAQHS